MRALVVAVALALVALLGMRPAVAADASLTVVPASQSVNEGATFTATINQNAGVTTTGGQTDLTFDPALVQILSVQRGPSYTGASFLLGVAPQTKEQAIAEANTTGTLQNAALFFLPGTGSVPAGETTFVTVSMQARPAVGGTSPLTLSGAEILNEAGDPLSVTMTNGEVTVLGPTPTATPPGQTPGPTPTPTASPTPTPTFTVPPTPTPPLEAFLSVTPSSITVPPGAEFSITVMQNANQPTTGAQTNISFDPAVIEIVSVSRGQGYPQNPEKTQIIMGVVPVTGRAAIAEANGTGTLKNVAVFYLPGQGSVPPGETAFLTVKLKGKADGRSPLTLSKMEMNDAQGEAVGVAANNGEIVVLTGAPLPGALAAARLPSSGGASDLDGGRSLLLLPIAGVTAVMAAGVLAKRLGRRQ